MIETESVSAQTLVPCALLSSRINRALTLQEIVCILADETISQFVTRDYCCLVLPAPKGHGIHFWRASRTAALNRSVASGESFNASYPALAQALASGVQRLIGKSELQRWAGDGFECDVRSVLALPLTTGEKCFGLLCFASIRPDSYTEDDAQSLMWLADHVAAAAQSALLRTQLESSLETEREIERLKSGFVNTLVRDVRLPLTSVLGLLELFESKLQAHEPFDMDDRRLLDSALENGDRMRQLLDNLMEVAQQHDRPLTLNLEPADATQLLEAVTEPVRGEAALRGVELKVRVHSHALRMQVDAQQTRRALCHLLTTALAATPDGGKVNIEAREITSTRASDQGKRLVVINITDSSEGISAEEVPFVFDAFWQAANSRTGAGRGVGLAIAKRIAAAHGGTVALRSQLGSGTTYSIVLPASTQEVESDVHRILIVEDAPELLLLLRKLIARMGYQVEIASGAQAALATLQEKSIDLVITDWAMPEMNGGELIRTFKQDERLRHIPTIVLTGHDTEGERRDAALAGCDRFLVKPAKRDELQRAISELLPNDVQGPKSKVQSMS